MRVNFETAYPAEVERAKKEQWPVLLPIGTLEYHSTHCPYGCDGLVSVGIANELAKKTDCLVMPPVWYGVASYAVGGPEKNTLNMDCDVLEAYVYNILKSLFKSGFTRNINILIFHQTEEFLPTALACMKAAKKLIFAYLEETRGTGWWGDNNNKEFYQSMDGQDNPWNWIRVFNGARMPENYAADHAGKYECSMLESLFPCSIKLERLDAANDWFAADAKEMSVELGDELVEKAVNSILKAWRDGSRCY